LENVRLCGLYSIYLVDWRIVQMFPIVAMKDKEVEKLGEKSEKALIPKKKNVT